MLLANAISGAQFIPEAIVDHKIDIADFSHLAYPHGAARSDGIVPLRKVKVSYKLKLRIIRRIYRHTRNYSITGRPEPEHIRVTPVAFPPVRRLS
jgi:hypothetical protein